MSDSAESTKQGIACDVDDCENRLVGLDDGWEFSRGHVCSDCIEYYNEHGRWPDEPELVTDGGTEEHGQGTKHVVYEYREYDGITKILRVLPTEEAAEEWREAYIEERGYEEDEDGLHLGQGFYGGIAISEVKYGTE